MQLSVALLTHRVFIYYHILTATFPTDGTDYSISIDDSTTEFLFEGAPQQECIEISILDDEIVEQSESFLVIINTTLTSQTVSLNPQYVFVTIIDDDRKCSSYLIHCKKVWVTSTTFWSPQLHWFCVHDM